MKFNWSISTLATLLASVSTFVSAEENSAIASDDSAVVKLTAATYEKFLNENPLVLTEFFAPWCGHCKTLGPEFSQAADILIEKDIKLAQIDCTEERDVCTEYGIRGYPSLKVFRGSDKEPSDYAGGRKSDLIVNYMLKQALPPVQVVSDASDVNDSIEENTEATIVQVLPQGISDENSGNSSFYQVADLFRDDFTFISTSCAEFVEKYGSDYPSYLVFRPDDVKPTVYKGEELDLTHLSDWISVETKPLFGEIDGSTFQSYMESNIPLAYYFYNEASERSAASEVISKVAENFRGAINFVGLDASKYGLHSKNLNMDQKFPLFVIHDLEKNLKYGISQLSDLNLEDIPSFVDKFVAKTLDPIIKSEAVPETQENAVIKLVGTSHDEIVQDEKKDVFVKYYAPWCGHCKKMEPTLEELAQIYAGDKAAHEKVVIADLDHTENDISGVEITGYPTLVLYPADKKAEPVTYEGARDLESMAQFIKNYGFYEVDALALKKEEVAGDDEDVKDEL